MNAKQVARVALRPPEAEAFVFWTRHARPFFPVLDELESLGLPHYFLYTINGYGPPLEARLPSIDVATATLVALSERLRPGSVVWRYDPILLGTAFPMRDHLERFAAIADKLEGHVQRVVTSLLEPYRKTMRRVGQLFSIGDEVVTVRPHEPEAQELLVGLASLAREHGMQLSACAQEADLSPLRISRAKCVDDELLSKLGGRDFSRPKDPGQRAACHCVVSKDIGIGDTCTFGCAYCYATRSDAHACRRHA
jgi:hypothetical protein